MNKCEKCYYLYNEEDCCYVFTDGRLKKGLCNDCNELHKAGDAIEYFINQGFIDELTSDKKFYVNVLIQSVKHLSKELEDKKEKEKEAEIWRQFS